MSAWPLRKLFRKQIQLTIDYDLQQIAEQSLGRVLVPRSHWTRAPEKYWAMVSHPALDPNDFAVRISGEDWKNLNRRSPTSIAQRAIQAQLAPVLFLRSSQLRPWLEDKVPPENFNDVLPGYANLLRPAVQVLVYGKRSHGVWACTSDPRVLRHFFLQRRMRLGIDRPFLLRRKFGLGHKTGIDLPAEEPGLMPSAEGWNGSSIASGMR